MEACVKQASFFDVVKTVLSGFIGIRRKSAHEQARIKPVHVIIAGVIGAVVFVLTLVTIVRIVTH
jgi:Protein of unknown function (DUF2970)